MMEPWLLKGERDRKYGLYIEAYALYYLCKENDGENDIFLYGEKKELESTRECFVVYGVSESLESKDMFLPYHMFPYLHVKKGVDDSGELQFYIEEKDSVYEIAGYYVFYEDNPIMKQMLIREQGFAVNPTLKACQIEEKSHRGNFAGLPQKKKRFTKLLDVLLFCIGILLLAVIVETLDDTSKINGFVEQFRQIQKILMR